MSIIDLHCDTISKLFEGNGEIDLLQNDLQVDIKKLNFGDVITQFFAIYFDLQQVRAHKKSPLLHAYEMKKSFDEQLRKYRDEIGLALNWSQVEKLRIENKVSGVLTIEEGGVLEGNITNLDIIYDWGIRLLTLTWNYPNEIGFPNGKDFIYDKGLTNFGKKVVQRMNEKGIMIDVSHLSDGGFWDVIDITTMPIVASHSCVREKMNHPRNLTKSMIKSIAETGGVIGLNFNAPFLGNSSVSMIEDMVNHIGDIYKYGGIESIAIGSDFDGIDCKVEIADSGEFQKLTYALRSAGYSEQQIEKITYKNARRVICDVLK